MKIPGVYSFSSDDAVRHESYQNISQEPTDPLLAIRYQPIDDQLTFRASYTKSFLAPSLFNLYGPTSFGFSNDLTNFQQYNGSVIGNDGQTNESGGSNALLEPTLATGGPSVWSTRRSRSRASRSRRTSTGSTRRPLSAASTTSRRCKASSCSDLPPSMRASRHSVTTSDCPAQYRSQNPARSQVIPRASSSRTA